MGVFGLEIGLEPVGLLMGVFEPEKFTRMYNCNVYNFEDTPLENRRSIPLGMMFLTLGLICEFLYLPCMLAIRKHMDSTCFKFMFYIAVADMFALFVSGVLTGYLALVGAVYCTAPKFIYFMGSWAICLWVTESTAEMVLAFNRCVELSSSYWADVLFHGKRTYLWMMIPTLYGLYCLLFTTPVKFSGIFVSWFFNPHVGYIDDFGKTYHNDLHMIHNYIVVVVLTGTYSIFALILTLKTWKLKGSSAGGGASRSQRRTFFQVILISSVNATAAFLYVYMQFVRITEFLIVLAQLTWMLSHGIPPIIYLLLNKTVRRDVAKMMVWSASKVCCFIKVEGGINTIIAGSRVGPTSSIAH
uniref:G_PROTEIN_RECEP_F1_2 domain-containing protein n=1 Tax=Globodera pallida TaxID=36090 RepID=A0A183C7K2_GLOPA